MIDRILVYAQEEDRDHEIVKRVIDLGDGLTRGVFFGQDLRAIREHGTESPQHTALLYRVGQRSSSTPTGGRDVDFVRELSELGLRVIVLTNYVQSATSRSAIKYLEAAAKDVWALGEMDVNTMFQRFSKVMHGQEISTSMKLDKPPKEGKVFVATPFESSHYQMMLDAVLPGLDGWKVAFGDESLYMGKDIGTKLRALILESRYVIANVGEEPPKKSRYNPNVFYEIGVADALEVPVLLVRPIREMGNPLPVDLHGKEIFPYYGPVHLAVSLRHGLWSKVANA